MKSGQAETAYLLKVSFDEEYIIKSGEKAL